VSQPLSLADGIAWNFTSPVFVLADYFVTGLADHAVPNVGVKFCPLLWPGYNTSLQDLRVYLWHPIPLAVAITFRLRILNCG